jgi:hypothetical protein
MKAFLQTSRLALEVVTIALASAIVELFARLSLLVKRPSRVVAITITTLYGLLTRI